MWFFLLFIFVPGANSIGCECGTDTTNSTCTYEMNLDNSTNITGCDCQVTGHFKQINMTVIPSVVFCTETTTTVTTTTTTTVSPIEVCEDLDNNTVCDYLEKAAELRCYTTTLSSDSYNITKYLMWFSTAWIIIWTIITIVINIMHSNKGHHRGVHIFEELCIILLMIVIGILNFPLKDDQDACKVVSVFSHFLMVLLCAIFVMEALFANSMVHGKSKKNGAIPSFLNYVIPIVLAAIPTGVAYWQQEENYGATLLHCFVALTTDMLWAFVIPCVMLLFLAVFKSQLACLACDKTNPNQDQEQCFWAKKSAKSLVLVALSIFTIWLTLMFAFDQQRLYLFVVAFLMCLGFGPGLFVAHTFCHFNTCTKWHKPGGLYALCPPQKEKEVIKYKYMDPVPQKTPTRRGPNRAAVSPVVLQRPPLPRGEHHTQAQHFYSWLTDGSTKEKSDDILFKPKPY